MLLAFMDMEEVLNCLHVVSLCEGSTDVAEQLMNFDTNDAHCYDPNEESRVRQVLTAVGSERFNNKIRALGKALSSTSSLVTHMDRRSSANTYDTGSSETLADAKSTQIYGSDQNSSVRILAKVDEEILS